VIGLLAYWLAQWVDPRAARPLAWAIVMVGAALLAWGALAAWSSSRDARIIESHEAKTSAKLERTGRQADASAAQRAEARRRAEETARKEFDNATVGIVDEGLTVRQRIDICRELREAGTDTALIPECGDVRAGVQTRP
jgi:hypothetical protein